MKQLPSNLKFIRPLITKLFRILNKRQKLQLVFLFIFTIGFSIVETLGISAIMPYISIASDTSLVESGIYKKFFDFFKFTSVESFLIAAGIAIILFYIFRGIYSIFLTWFTKRFSVNTYKYFSKKVFKNYLSISYKAYTQKNSGEIMHAVTNETVEVGVVIFNLIHFCAEFFTILLVYTVIVILDWKMTLIITAILLFFVIILLSLITKITRKQGVKRLEANKSMHRILKKSLGNYKYVKLKGSEKDTIQNFDNIVEVRSKSEIITDVLGAAPKSILESIGFSFLLAVVVFIIWTSKDASKVIPVISMYALALYRILPSIHRLLSNISKIAYSERTLDSVYDNLHIEINKEKSEKVEFNNDISLKNIYFKYEKGGTVLHNINLKIKKGEKIAFVGESGSGKSTLVDIITGIHKPDSGHLYIDDIEINDANVRSWRKKIGYIPQNIFLFDGTVAENVAFGSDYDEEKIIIALKTSNIWDFLVQKEGINTLVGDGGIQLSGGQQQRIGIARALYDNPQILVLDEATSSLDNETEKKIMEEIYSLTKNKTLIIIAHRLSTVDRCERKIIIENGKVVSQ